jgi:hypothetical protein
LPGCFDSGFSIGGKGLKVAVEQHHQRDEPIMLRDHAAEMEDRIEELKHLLGIEHGDLWAVVTHAVGLLARFDIEIGSRREGGWQMGPEMKLRFEEGLRESFVSLGG